MFLCGYIDAYNAAERLRKNANFIPPVSNDGKISFLFPFH